MTTTGSPIHNFVKSALNQISTGVGSDFVLSGPINFNLSTVNTGSKGGKLNIQVLNLGGEVSEQQVQRINFSVRPKDDKADKLAEEFMTALKDAIRSELKEAKKK